MRKGYINGTTEAIQYNKDVNDFLNLPEILDLLKSYNREYSENDKPFFPILKTPEGIIFNSELRDRFLSWLKNN